METDRYPACWAYKCERCSKLAFLYFKEPIRNSIIAVADVYYPTPKRYAYPQSIPYCDTCLRDIVAPNTAQLVRLVPSA